jgi:hypothetical protein
MDKDATPPVRKVVPAPPHREVRPDGVWVEIDGVFLPEVSPELRARFDHFDAMTKGMTPDEILAILPDMYLDAEGFTRIRRQQIRAVPDLD